MKTASEIGVIRYNANADKTGDRRTVFFLFFFIFDFQNTSDGRKIGQPALTKI